MSCPIPSHAGRTCWCALALETGPKVRKVSLFTRAGVFEKYVHVAGTPRVVTHLGKTYTSYDFPSLSFRECDAEEGTD